MLAKKTSYKPQTVSTHTTRICNVLVAFSLTTRASQVSSTPGRFPMWWIDGSHDVDTTTQVPDQLFHTDLICVF